MKHLAITGNMGSGKSTVSRMFEKIGIPVYYSDPRAKLLMNTHDTIREKLTNIFGEEVYETNGTLNRPFLGKKIFHDKALLSQVNAIVHPVVREDYLQWRNTQNAAYTLQESALTFEIQAHKIMDATILVYAPEDLLIQRVLKRDNLPLEDIKARLNKQMPQSEKLKKADYIIMNGLTNVLSRQIHQIHLQILNE